VLACVVCCCCGGVVGGVVAVADTADDADAVAVGVAVAAAAGVVVGGVATVVVVVVVVVVGVVGVAAVADVVVDNVSVPGYVCTFRWKTLRVTTTQHELVVVADLPGNRWMHLSSGSDGVAQPKIVTESVAVCASPASGGGVCRRHLAATCGQEINADPMLLHTFQTRTLCVCDMVCVKTCGIHCVF